MICLLVISYFKNKESAFKINLFNVVVFALWFVVALEENVLSDQFAIYLMFGIILMLAKKPTTETEEPVEETDLSLAEGAVLVDNAQKFEDNKIVKKSKK